MQNRPPSRQNYLYCPSTAVPRKDGEVSNGSWNPRLLQKGPQKHFAPLLRLIAPTKGGATPRSSGTWPDKRCPLPLNQTCAAFVPLIPCNETGSGGWSGRGNAEEKRVLGYGVSDALAYHSPILGISCSVCPPLPFPGVGGRATSFLSQGELLGLRCRHGVVCLQPHEMSLGRLLRTKAAFSI